MKKILSVALLIACFNNINAQYAKKISLRKGQTISCATKTNTDTEMSMGSMKNDISTVAILSVIDENEQSYILTNTMTKMKMEMEGMGQNMSFDSDNKDDRESEIGKTVSEKLNVPDTFIVDKISGSCQLKNSKTEEGGSSMSAGISMMAGDKDNQGPSDAFLIIPSDKKIGDSWDVTITNKGLTTKKTYTLKSIDQTTATLQVSGTTTGTVEQEVQGMTMNMTMDTKVKGQLKVNIQTGVVFESNSDMDMNNSMDMMGQQMQISSKGTTAVTYTSK